MTLDELSAILDLPETDSQKQETLTAWLAKRDLRVTRTLIGYTAEPWSIANNLCYEVAKRLCQESKFTNHSLIKILMPSLTITGVWSLLEQGKFDETIDVLPQYGSFLLSDELFASGKGLIIPYEDILLLSENIVFYSMIFQSEAKANALPKDSRTKMMFAKLENSIRKNYQLTPDEIARIRQFNPLGEEFFKEQENFTSQTILSGTPRQHMQALITAFRKGSSHGGNGTFDNAGSVAMEGLALFFEYWSQLPNEKRVALEACSTNAGRSISQVLNVVKTASNVLINSDTCVVINASYLQGVLENPANSALLDSVSGVHKISGRFNERSNVFKEAFLSLSGSDKLGFYSCPVIEKLIPYFDTLESPDLKKRIFTIILNQFILEMDLEKLHFINAMFPSLPSDFCTQELKKVTLLQLNTSKEKQTLVKFIRGLSSAISANVIEGDEAIVANLLNDESIEKAALSICLTLSEPNKSTFLAAHLSVLSQHLVRLFTNLETHAEFFAIVNCFKGEHLNLIYSTLKADCSFDAIWNQNTSASTIKRFQEIFSKQTLSESFAVNEDPLSRIIESIRSKERCVETIKSLPNPLVLDFFIKLEARQPLSFLQTLDDFNAIFSNLNAHQRHQMYRILKAKFLPLLKSASALDNILRLSQQTADPYLQIFLTHEKSLELIQEPKDFEILSKYLSDEALGKLLRAMVQEKTHLFTTKKACDFLFEHEIFGKELVEHLVQNFERSYSQLRGSDPGIFKTNFIRSSEYVYGEPLVKAKLIWLHAQGLPGSRTARALRVVLDMPFSQKSDPNPERHPSKLRV